MMCMICILCTLSLNRKAIQTKSIIIHPNWKISVHLVSTTATTKQVSFAILVLYCCLLSAIQKQPSTTRPLFYAWRVIALRTTVELFRRQRGHRSALQPAGVVAGGRSLSVARLSVLLEEVGQPQQLTVAVQGVGIQSAANIDGSAPEFANQREKKRPWKRWADNVLAGSVV